jgi:tRNA threonylcarbamoyl adenosine modification protein YjeE
MSVSVSEGSGESLTPSEMAAWAQTFVRGLELGAVIALHGELGAGKTTLVRSMCQALGVRELSAVTSPTFALLHEYDTPNGMVLHADLYRLRHSTELEQLGWDELLGRAQVTFVEWPERADGYLPANALHVWLAHVPGDPGRRTVRVSAAADGG